MGYDVGVWGEDGVRKRSYEISVRYEVRRDQMKCLHCGHEAIRHVRVVKDVNGRNVAIPMGSCRMLESCPGCGSKFPAWRMKSCGMVALQGMATWNERMCV